MKKIKLGKAGSSIAFWMNGRIAKRLLVIKLGKIYIEIYKDLGEEKDETV